MAKNGRVYLDNAKSIFFIVLVVVVIRSSFAAPYKIPSGSMIPSLEIGDHIFVSKLSFGLKLPIPFTNYNLIDFDKPERGQVIVFEYPEDPALDYIKRVVGLPGDTISLKNKELFINGEKVVRSPIKVFNGRSTRFGGVADVFDEQLGSVRHKIQYYSEFPGEDFELRNLIAELKHLKKIPANSPEDRIPEGYYFVMGDNRDDSRDSRYWGFVPFTNIRGLAKIIWLSWNGEASSSLDYIRFDRLFKLID